ncbi:COG2129 Predicted phosphoesterases, related to the Icc protein [uncultured Caudovirales phage]|uniref:COG2129 Predicted phosphoesterases, related to the Icc protein n=1 Tax=uncultured Caudovirales phage TaxID=2100421 RepID=A0A6J5RIW5_9CAUD|nr:COG2129 Predicted phosphoesterases, related to the Icc protein [uncultured Caudovirales phage]
MKIKKVSDQISRKFKLRVLHISDTHGGFPDLYGRFDCVLHTGDFFPNSKAQYNGDKSQEAIFQLNWLKEKIPEIKKWLRGHTFLYVLGNHDFIFHNFVEQELTSAGIKSFDLTDKTVMYEGVNFYGFPYIPFIDGSWNYERQIPEMQAEVDKMIDVLNQSYVDVLACHAPPYPHLDLTIGNEAVGSTVISHALDYKLQKEMMPQYYCCGHIHEAHGITMRNGLCISNAALTRHIIEI